MPQNTIGLAINPNGAVGRAIGHVGTRPAVLNRNAAALTGDGAIQPWYAYRLAISSNHENIVPLLLPNTSRRLQLWHTWTATGGITVNTSPTVRAFGLLPVAISGEQPTLASLPLNGNTPHKDTPANWPEVADEFLPLVNDAGNSTALQLASSNVMTCNGSAYGDFTYTDIPRHSGIPTCIDTQGCQLVIVTISVAAVYSAAAYGKIMGRVFA